MQTGNNRVLLFKVNFHWAGLQDKETNAYFNSVLSILAGDTVGDEGRVWEDPRAAPAQQV